MDITIKEYHEGATAELERYTSSEPVEGYEDLTQIWILRNLLEDKIIATINGKAYEITRQARPGLLTDKASTPGQRSDWFAARRAYVWHDIDFSTHALAQFEENQDQGFRATNSLFLADINWHIKQAQRRGVISRFRAFFWRIKARLWYRAVSSIAGQGRYVNGDPARGNHGKYSTTTIRPLRP